TQAERERFGDGDLRIHGDAHERCCIPVGILDVTFGHEAFTRCNGLEACVQSEVEFFAEVPASGQVYLEQASSRRDQFAIAVERRIAGVKLAVLIAVDEVQPDTTGVSCVPDLCAQGVRVDWVELHQVRRVHYRQFCY